MPTNALPNLDQDTAEKATKAAQKAAAMERAQAALASNLAAGVGIGDAESDVRAFVAPIEKNTRFLVKAGTPLTVNDPNSPRGKRMYEREGDVWVEFIDGIVVLNPEDTLAIAWCEENPAICRDIFDPMTEAWAYMKEMQVPTANQEARLPGSIDVEAILRGDARGSKTPHQSVQRAKDRVNSLNEG
jgi:hypothetical protein